MDFSAPIFTKLTITYALSFLFQIGGKKAERILYDWCVCVWYRNLNEEAAKAGVGLLR